MERLRLEDFRPVDFRPEDLRADDLRPDDFFAVDLRLDDRFAVDFRAPLFRVEERFAVRFAPDFRVDFRVDFDPDFDDDLRAPVFFRVRAAFFAEALRFRFAVALDLPRAEPLLTVAQARRSASSSLTPFSS